jgi:sugar phosphate isomerase/epimerase
MSMKTASIPDRTAVCSWSLQPSAPRDLVRDLLATGARRVQLALDPLRASPAVWGDAAALLRENGISIVSGMFGCVGEDYSSLESIRRTGGIAPDETWEQNLHNVRATVVIAARLGLKLVTFHAGFIPHSESDPAFGKMMLRLAEVARCFAAEGITLGLETGQETAADLLRVLQQLAVKNVAVNFDPANMILYDKGDPIEAVRTLSPWIRQVHIKDANRTKNPGTWGEEVAAGQGQVNWPAFFSTLKSADYNGDFVIEREAGNQRIADIRAARELLERIAA